MRLGAFLDAAASAAGTWLTSSQRNDASQLATLVAAEDNRKRKIEETEDEKAHVDASYRSRF